MTNGLVDVLWLVQKVMVYGFCKNVLNPILSFANIQDMVIPILRPRQQQWLQKLNAKALNGPKSMTIVTDISIMFPSILPRLKVKTRTTIFRIRFHFLLLLEFCRTKAGHLLSLSSSDEEYGVVSALGVYDDVYFWIGLHQDDGGQDNSGYYWTDETPTDYLNFAG